MSKHIAVYIRVSTRPQSTKSQEPALKQWLKDNAKDQSYKLYKDKASGVTAQRNGLLRLIDQIDKGLVAKVLVWKFDRLGRAVLAIAPFVELCKDRQIVIESICDGRVDVSTATGRYLAYQLLSAAQYESDSLSERLSAGIAVARAKGKKWGGSVGGIRKVVTDKQVETICSLYDQRMPIAKIGRLLGLSRPTIYNVLSEPTLPCKKLG